MTASNLFARFNASTMSASVPQIQSLQKSAKADQAFRGICINNAVEPLLKIAMSTNLNLKVAKIENIILLISSSNYSPSNTP